MRNKVVTTTISITVLLILIASAIMPIVSDNAIAHTAEQDESAYDYLATTSFGHTYTFVTGGAVSIDGETLGDTTMNILSDQFKVIWYNKSATMYDMNGTGTVGITQLVIDADGAYHYTTSSGNVDGATKLSWFVGPALSGNYVMAVTSLSGLHYNANSQLYFCASSSFFNESSASITAATSYFYAKGTMNNMTAGAYIKNSSGVWKSAQASITLNPKEFNDGSYGFNTSFGSSATAGDYTTSPASGVVFAPLEYRSATDSDSQLNNLIMVIPIILIVSVLMLAVGLVSRRE